MSGSGSGPPNNQMVAGMAAKAVSGFMATMSALQAEANTVTSDLMTARQAQLRYQNQTRAERAKVNTAVGYEQINEKKELIRTAEQVFTDAEHIKRAKAAHDMVSSIGGLDELGKLVEKAEAIKNRKVDPEMLDYEEVLASMSIGVGSIGLMTWDDGGKSFIKITDQFNGITSSTTICFTFLVHCRSGKSLFMSLSKDLLARTFVLVKGDNAQKLFDDVCSPSNIDALYKTHTSATPPRLRYLKHEFTRVVTQESRDGINQCPGLSNLLNECERASAAAAAAASKRDGKRTMSAAEYQHFTQATAPSGPADDDDDEPVFTHTVTRAQRDKKGFENAIVL